MIDLYYWATPNGHKITMMLEEIGLPYQIKPINILQGDQLTTRFLQISPNNKIPAIVDHQPEDGGSPLSLFESGAILLYLAQKSGRLIPDDFRGRNLCLQWLFWQIGGLGPMAGQNHHFAQHAPEKLPYAIKRYVKETTRLYKVLDAQLADGRDYIVEDYSIADVASYPWAVSCKKQGQDLRNFPALRAWFERVAARPATRRAYALAKPFETEGSPGDEAARKILFGQDGSALDQACSTASSDPNKRSASSRKAVDGRQK